MKGTQAQGACSEWRAGPVKVWARHCFCDCFILHSRIPQDSVFALSNSRTVFLSRLVPYFQYTTTCHLCDKLRAFGHIRARQPLRLGRERSIAYWSSSAVSSETRRRRRPVLGTWIDVLLAGGKRWQRHQPHQIHKSPGCYACLRNSYAKHLPAYGVSTSSGPLDD